MALDDLVQSVEPYVDRTRFPIPEERLPATVAALRSRLSTFSAINDHLAPFVPLLDSAGSTARDRLMADGKARRVVAAAKEALERLPNWDDETMIGQAVRSAGKNAGVKGADLYIPIRVAITGEEHGPPLPAVLYVQGREGALPLMDQALAATSD